MSDSEKILSEISKYSNEMKAAAGRVGNPLTQWSLFAIGALLFVFLAFEVLLGAKTISDTKFFAILFSAIVLAIVGQFMVVMSDRSQRWYYEADLNLRLAYFKYAIEDDKLRMEYAKQRDEQSKAPKRVMPTAPFDTGKAD